MLYIHHIQVIAIMCQIYVKAPYCKQIRTTYEILYHKKKKKKKIQYLSTFTFCSSHSQNNSPEALELNFIFSPSITHKSPP